MTKMKTHSSPSQEGANAPASGFWADGRSDLQSASHHQPGTRGRRRVRHCRPSRHVVLGATVAHSWPLQLLENERLFFSPMLPPSPSLVFLPGLELSILAVQKTFHSHDKDSNGVVGIPSRFSYREIQAINHKE